MAAKENIMSSIKVKKGYFTLEAAIFLPIFILGVLALSVLILFSGTEEKVGQIALDELGKTAAEAYVYPAAPGFSAKLEQRIKKESAGVKKVNGDRFLYLYKKGNDEGQIYLSVRADIGTGLPAPFQKTAEIQKEIKCRGLIGKKNSNPVFSFDEMEKVGEFEPVWIFPMEGKRYHREQCTYVSANARQLVLNHRLKGKYAPCRLCNAETLSVGSVVFCFPASGEVYHRGTCKAIKKYIKEIDKTEAQKKGYTPCRKCGGG